MTQVALEGWLICTDEAEAAVVRRLLPEHLRSSRAEPGCLRFDVAQGDDPLIWEVRELFVDQAAFASHQGRVKASRWGHETAGIRRDYRVGTP